MPDPYKRLAERLDALPNGFPPTEDGAELRLLAKIFTPDEAELASQLRLTKETPAQLSERIGGDPKELKDRLKAMARKGLIAAGRAEGGLGYGLMPFVVGIYELQIERMDAELARLFEDYYQAGFKGVVGIGPAVSRVIPVGESVRVDMEISPYESVAEILAGAQSWGVLDCICRVQKALIGDPCDHPVDVCMVLSRWAGAFNGRAAVRAVSYDDALATLRRAAEAGLVHTVSNTQEGLVYICSCCTCSCGILRGLAELGAANVLARSAFVNQVDEALCTACGICLDFCQFGALALREVMEVNEARCVGCGVCVSACPSQALALVRRPGDELTVTPVSEEEWRSRRAEARGIDLAVVE